MNFKILTVIEDLVPEVLFPFMFLFVKKVLLCIDLIWSQNVNENLTKRQGTKLCALVRKRWECAKQNNYIHALLLTATLIGGIF